MARSVSPRVVAARDASPARDGDASAPAPWMGDGISAVVYGGGTGVLGPPISPNIGMGVVVAGGVDHGVATARQGRWELFAAVLQSIHLASVAIAPSVMWGSAVKAIGTALAATRLSVPQDSDKALRLVLAIILFVVPVLSLALWRELASRPITSKSKRHRGSHHSRMLDDDTEGGTGLTGRLSDGEVRAFSGLPRCEDITSGFAACLFLKRMFDEFLLLPFLLSAVALADCTAPSGEASDGEAPLSDEHNMLSCGSGVHVALSIIAIAGMAGVALFTSVSAPLNAATANVGFTAATTRGVRTVRHQRLLAFAVVALAHLAFGATERDGVRVVLACGCAAVCLLAAARFATTKPLLNAGLNRANAVLLSANAWLFFTQATAVVTADEAPLATTIMVFVFPAAVLAALAVSVSPAVDGAGRESTDTTQPDDLDDYDSDASDAGVEYVHDHTELNGGEPLESHPWNCHTRYLKIQVSHTPVASIALENAGVDADGGVTDSGSVFHAFAARYERSASAAEPPSAATLSSSSGDAGTDEPKVTFAADDATAAAAEAHIFDATSRDDGEAGGAADDGKARAPRPPHAIPSRDSAAAVDGDDDDDDDATRAAGGGGGGDAADDSGAKPHGRPTKLPPIHTSAAAQHALGGAGAMQPAELSPLGGITRAGARRIRASLASGKPGAQEPHLLSSPLASAATTGSAALDPLASSIGAVVDPMADAGDALSKMVTFGRKATWTQLKRGPSATSGVPADDSIDEGSLVGKVPLSLHVTVCGDEGMRELSQIVCSHMPDGHVVFDVTVVCVDTPLGGTDSVDGTEPRAGAYGVARDSVTHERATLRGFDAMFSRSHEDDESDDDEAAAGLTTEGISMLGSIVSQPSSPLRRMRSLTLVGMSMAYEQLTTLSYCALRMNWLRRLDIGMCDVDEESAMNAVYMLRRHSRLVFLNLGSHHDQFSTEAVAAMLEIADNDFKHARPSQLGPGSLQFVPGSSAAAAAARAAANPTDAMGAAGAAGAYGDDHGAAGGAVIGGDSRATSSTLSDDVGPLLSRASEDDGAIPVRGGRAVSVDPSAALPATYVRFIDGDPRGASRGPADDEDARRASDAEPHEGDDEPDGLLSSVAAMVHNNGPGAASRPFQSEGAALTKRSRMGGAEEAKGETRTVTFFEPRLSQKRSSVINKKQAELLANFSHGGRVTSEITGHRASYLDAEEEPDAELGLGDDIDGDVDDDVAAALPRHSGSRLSINFGDNE